ncbi:MAG: hypothetical protein JW708_09765, partial [Vallitaleaceae bacterium]|nr:hypothetical protein [Vallitaleaceae bacterium]
MKYQVLKKKGLSLLMTIALLFGSISTSTLFAQEETGNIYAAAKAYGLGSGKEITAATLFSQESGFGFSDVTFPDAAAGWVGSIYVPRVSSVTEGAASYVVEAADYLEIRSKVWTETENTGYGVYTYENTSTLDFLLENADYTVTVDLVNPTTETLTIGLEAEDITKVSGLSLAAGATSSQSFTACLIDGKLNLKFLETSLATASTSESAAVEKSVYVNGVTILRQEDQGASTVPTVYIASDSTVQTYDAGYYPQTGWGQVLYSFFNGAQDMVESEAVNANYGQSQVYSTSSAVIENRAIGGRSAKSFVEEGKLDDLLEDIKQGDYLLVQWGHNDATYSRPNRYVSVEDFAKWLQYYIDGAKQRGATPILVTPVARYSPN